MSDAYRISRRSAILAAAGAAKSFSANDQIGFGHIGVGIRGTQLLNNFKALPGVNIAAVADIYDGHHIAAREATRPDLPVTRDYTEILARKDVDAVVIAVPDHWHLKIATEALNAGKHVYLEKPMTWSIEQGMELRKTVEQSKKILQVGSGQGSTAQVKKAKELIKAGALGKVNMIRASNNRNTPEGAWVYPIPPDASPKTIDWKRFIGPAPQRAYDPKVFFRWRCWWEYSGGVATDLFVHLLTQIHAAMDVKAPKSVVSLGGLYRWKDGRTVPDVLNSVFEYEEGFLADMYVNLGNGRPSNPFTIMGTEGTLTFESGARGNVKLVLTPEPDPAPVQRYGSLGWPAQMREKYLKSNPERPPAKKPQEFEIEPGTSHEEFFLEAIREGKPKVETAFEGFAACGAAHLANMAYRKGRRMSWDVETGQVMES